MIELDRGNYKLLNNVLNNIGFNTSFARVVIKQDVTGRIYVDDVSDPKSWYILHPYGMSLLGGDTNNQQFNSWFADYALNKHKTRRSPEWMQVFPAEWNDKIRSVFNDKLVAAPSSGNTNENCIEIHKRVNFRFNRQKYLTLKEGYGTHNFEIVRTTESMYDQMKGNVVPSNFWRNAQEFCSKGVGFSLFHEGKLATTAYSAFITDHDLELGMETFPEFRGRGMALHACAALIDYCLESDHEPVWACNRNNIPSYNLAQKLGFEIHLTFPYYRLPAAQ